MKLEELCKSVTIKSIEDESQCIIEGGRGFHCVLSYKGHTMSCPFSMGSAHTGDPKVADVMHSLLLDSSAVDMDFEDWCSDFGYDTDSRKARDTYDKCLELGEAFLNMVGDDFQLFQEASQDY